MSTTVLNKIKCLSDLKNTGTGNCVLDPSDIRGGFSLPHGTVLMAADVAAIQTWLQGAILNAKTTRIYPFPNFETLTDNSEAPVEAKYGYGRTKIVRDGYVKWTFEFLDGALCALKAWQSFNGIVRDWFFVDDKGTLYGTKVGATLMGITGEFHAFPFKASDGSKPATYQMSFTFRPEQINQNVGFVSSPSGFDPLTLAGLQDIILTGISGSTATVFKGTALTGCDQVDLGALFLTTMTTISTWVGTKSDGTTLVPTSVTYTPGTNGDPGFFLVTFSAAVVSVTLISTSALATAGITGFEANTQTVLLVA